MWARRERLQVSKRRGMLTFRIIPFDPFRHFLRSGELQQLNGVQARQNTMHAFIIEDEYLIGQSLSDMLESLGFTTFSYARSEDAAVAGANERGIDLITADVRLLPGDGVRAVEAICAKHDIPVIFITGYKDELLDRAPSATVIQKPVNADELAAAVGQVLGSRLPEQNEMLVPNAC